MEIDSVGDKGWEEDLFGPFGNHVGGSVRGEVDKDGNSSASAEGHFTSRDRDGGSTSVEVEGRVSRNREGKVATEISGQISYEREFSPLHSLKA